MQAPHRNRTRVLLLLLQASASAWGAEDRIKAPLDTSRLVQLKGHLNPNASPEFDQGAAPSDMPIRYATLCLRPTAGLENFVTDQQIPSSPNFHKWLTPEQFGDRFGLNGNDIAKLTDWLKSAGFTVHDTARGRLWITFTGTASQVSSAFHTQIHRYKVNGVTHFANSTDISIPAAFEPVVLGIQGLSDFNLQPLHTAPRLNSGSAHFLAPDDLATIYNLTPLYNSGIDGTGQKIAIVGTSDLNLNDMAIWRAHFNLPPLVPQVVVYGPDPGVNADGQGEANLDLQVSGAIARNATQIYVNAGNVNLAAQYAVDQNLAPVMSMSYGGCEFTDFATQTLRAVAQQANAQGITWMISSGDSGAATCDRSSPTPQASKGKTVSSPASFPEVTAVGGTEFNEGTGSYWGASNNANRASALSYIPERVWNDSSLVNQLEGGGGGSSAFFTKPVWQTGPGVPNDGARDLPDVSFAASADHDGFDIYYQGAYYVFGGTSASSPLFAGIVALLNQALLNQNPSAQGLGNINPALYQLAQATTDVFHDVTVGDNIVPCAQGSPDCVNGSFGFSATPGYDLATGLGSVDAARLIAEWNTGISSVTTLSVQPSSVSIGDTVQLTATVTGAGAIPSGSVTFVADDVTLGSAKLIPAQNSSSAQLSVPAATIAGGNLILGALYTGDASYLASSGSATLSLILPTSGSFVIPTVTPNPVHQLGSSWPYQLRLSELAGVATKVTAFTINSINNIANLPSPNIPAHGSISAALAGGGLTVPLNRDFHFEGVDASGTTWTQDLVVPFLGPLGQTRVPGITLTLSPSTMQQNPQANAGCQWSQQLTIQETGGYQTTLSGFAAGSKTLTSSLPQIFGTTRIAPLGIIAGTVCYASAQTPSQSTYLLTGTTEGGSTVAVTAVASFASASAAPATFEVSARSGDFAPAPTPFLSLTSGSGSIDLKFSAGSPAWAATVFPASTKWLTASALTGTGDSTLQLQTSTAGLSNGVYNAFISIQAQDALPQSIQVPITLTVGASANVSITGVGNAASGTQAFAPGQLIAVYGSNLAASLQIAGIQPLPLTLARASATVDGVSAPLWFVSPNQINLQIPYETPAGPAVLGINNSGQVASFTFNVAPTAPGLFAYNGSLVPYPSAQTGQTIVAFVTGDGDVTPTLATGATPPASTTLARIPISRQPLSLTVNGEPAAIVFSGIVPGLIGVTQVNFTVPVDAKPGVLPVVVTVGGVSSAPVNLTVTPGVSTAI